MNKLKDFKSIADRSMKHITVSDALKEKTLQRCRKRNNNFFKIALVPAACLCVFITAVYLRDNSIKIQQPGNEAVSGTQNASIMTAKGNSTMPASPEGNLSNNNRTTVSVSLKNLTEAKKYMDNIPLVPAYLPEGFKLRGIQAVSFDNDRRRSLWVEYVSGDKSFTIGVEQESEWKSFEGYEDVQINKLEGHMKSFDDSSYIGSEVRWIDGKALYTVEGAVPKAEALKIAKSLE